MTVTLLSSIISGSITCTRCLQINTSHSGMYVGTALTALPNNRNLHQYHKMSYARTNNKMSFPNYTRPPARRVSQMLLTKNCARFNFFNCLLTAQVFWPLSTSSHPKNLGSQGIWSRTKSIYEETIACLWWMHEYMWYLSATTLAMNSLDLLDVKLYQHQQ